MKYCYAFLFSFIFFTTANAQIKYVTEYGGGTMDGSSWANAWSGQIFADTIYSVSSGTQVWVAKGTYKATKNSAGTLSANHTTTTFNIQSGVKLIGGFEGIETAISQRVDSLIHGINNTVLEAFDLPAQTYASASNKLLTLLNANDSTEVDGFSLGHAQAANIYIASTGNNASSPVIKNCLLLETALVYMYSSYRILIETPGTQLSTPVVINCFFTSFQGGNNGSSGIEMRENCKVSITNCTFSYCKGGYMGSCIGFNASTGGGSINNCTFFKNFSGDEYSGFQAAISSYMVGDSIFLNNCIFRDNFTAEGFIANVFKFLGDAENFYSAKNCNFQSQNTGYAVEPTVKIRCFSLYPQFTDTLNLAGADNIYGTSDDGLSLALTSPSKDSGFNNLVPSFINKDIRGKERVSGCRVDMGAYELQVPAAGNIILPENTSQNCTQYPVGTGTVYTDPATCLTIAKLTPSGANPVTGTVKVCIQKDAAVQFVSGIPYVQRHYDIEPLQNASTATSAITLYFTQEEFDNYNLVAGSFPNLPTSPSDLAGIANIKIEQNHGVSLTSVPGTYNGTTVYIDPADTDIIWNATSNIWEVSFNVTGFSGFFITTYPGVLPITLSDFSGIENGGTVKLNWHTVSEINSKYFDVERSADGIYFETIGRVNAAGNSVGQFYLFNDNQPVKGLNYYKLGMVDINGSKKYSATVKVNINSKSGGVEMQVSPNPATTSTNITLSGKINGKISIIIYDINGRNRGNIFTGTLNAGFFSTTADISKFQKGIYIVEIQMEHEKIRNKLIIQ